MKYLLIISTELLSFIGLGFVLGHFIDKFFKLEGWATLGCVTLLYILWFIKFYKRLRKST